MTSKKTTLSLLILVFCTLSISSYSQVYEWAKSIGGTGNEQGSFITIDASGNVYTTGYFQGTADFDPGSGTSNLTSAGNYDVFISKLDSSGNFLWAKSMGGISDEKGQSIAIDAFGNIYTTGYFYGTADFDPGSGMSNLTPVGGTDIFISKLDSSGNFLWAKGMGSSSFDGGISITIDSSGNVYTTGYFQGTVDFDPGSGSSNLTAAGIQDIFISKLDSSGNFLWAKSMGGTGSDIVKSIAIDASGNIYTYGYFFGTADFDPGSGISNLTSAGSQDIFISKLDSSGNFLWVKHMGGTASSLGKSIAIDASGNVYTTGYFSGTVDFDPGSGTSNLTATFFDLFISKLDSSGNFLWVKDIGGTDGQYGNSITLDASGNIYTTGYFEGTADFDPGSGTSNLTSAGYKDIFISKLDSSGNFLWAKRMGGTSYDEGNSIAIDDSGNVYTTGYFEGTVNFNPGSGTSNLTSVQGRDIFISKLSPCLPYTGIDTQTACDSLTWIDGVTYYSSNFTATDTLVNSAGCDSIIALNLTVNHSFNTVDTVFACENYTWINGVTYTASNNTAVDTLTTVNGCDSIVTLNLTISNLASNFTFTDNGNGNYSFTNSSTGNYTNSHWAFGDGTTNLNNNPSNTYAVNGTYVVVLAIHDSNVVGDSCISYFTDTIIVTGASNITQCNAGWTVFADSTTGGVTIVNSSTGTNLTYHWDFGDGDTSNLQFPSHTYASNGPFNLCLTINDGNGCSDSYCDSISANGVLFKNGFDLNVVANYPLGIQNLGKEGEVKIYPNPTSTTLTIETQNFRITKLQIRDNTGKVVKTITSNFDIVNVESLATGVYHLELIGESETVTKKFIKQ